MKKLKSHFKFNKQERSGIFFLLLFLIAIQLGYYVYETYQSAKQQVLILDSTLQAEVDALKKEVIKKDSIKIYPFNPNFLSDYKGYTLGLSLEEIDRLKSFRATNKFINSKEEFRQVTKVSNSLLARISPYFKFPNWTQNKAKTKLPLKTKNNQSTTIASFQKKDLNSVSAKDLQLIYGVGEKLSARIVKFRDRLGGFLIDDQLLDVYFLEKDVAKRILKKYTVLEKPVIVKINVNKASAQELAELAYIQKSIAQRIVNYRNLNGSINSLNELLKIDEFPRERFDRIALYLSL